LFEYRTDQLKKDEEYRIAVILGVDKEIEIEMV